MDHAFLCHLCSFLGGRSVELSRHPFSDTVASLPQFEVHHPVEREFPSCGSGNPPFLLKTSKFQAAPFALLQSSAAPHRPITAAHNHGITSSFSASSVKYPKKPAPQIIATNRPAPIAIDRGRIFAFKYSRITV